MLSIGQFFKRIQGKQAQEMLLRTVISDALNKHTGIKAEQGAISYKSGVVNVSKLSSSARSQIFIKKQQIINEINSLQDYRKIEDIR